MSLILHSGLKMALCVNKSVVPDFTATEQVPLLVELAMAGFVPSSVFDAIAAPYSTVSTNFEATYSCHALSAAHCKTAIDPLIEEATFCRSQNE